MARIELKDLERTQQEKQQEAKGIFGGLDVGGNVYSFDTNSVPGDSWGETYVGGQVPFT